MVYSLQVKQLKCAASSREREYWAHSADCEAQLVRLRSEVTRISQSYEQLKEKRYHQKSSPKETELRQELDRVKMKLHLSNEDVRKAVGRVSQLETEAKKMIEREQSKHSHHNTAVKTMADVTSEEYSLLQPVQAQETVHFLEEMFNTHCHQLNQEILRIFGN